MKNDAPILFRANGQRFKKEKPAPSSAMGVFLDEKNRTLTIEGITYSLDFLATFAPKDGEPRGPFWVKRDGDTVAIYEMDEEAVEAAKAAVEN